jgi:hypothetical protein
MKHTIKFKFPTPGFYEARLMGAHLSQNRWTRGLQYHFEFELTHRVTRDLGISAGEPLSEVIRYERIIQLTHDNENLFKFLQMLHWPSLELATGDASQFEAETDTANNIILPLDMPRLYVIEFTQGSTRAAQFKALEPLLPQEVM